LAGRATIAQSIWTGFDGVWFVKTGKNAVEIRDRLKCLSAPDEGIAIALLAGFAAWHGFDAESEKWLLKHL